MSSTGGRRRRRPAADLGSKRLIGLAPDAWVQWVTQRPDVVADGIVTGEFQWISRETDALVRAFSPQEGHFLVLTEIQLRYEERMPRRMQMRWDMAIIEQSPWYQEIIERGRRQGLLEGRQEGRQEGRLALLLHLLEYRFGSVLPELTGRLQQLSSDQLDVLAEAVFSADSLAAFEARLPD